MTHDPIDFLVRRSVWIPNVENLILMVAAVINLDFVPLFFFFFLYSALEILIARTMEDYRFRFIEIEDEFDNEEIEDEEFEDEEFEDEEFEDEEFEDEEFEDEEFDGEEAVEDDFDNGERERILPIDLDVFHTGELEDDDDFDDDDDEEDEEGEEDYEEEEELHPVVRLRRDPIVVDDYEGEYDFGVDYEGEDDDEGDYEEEELEELFPVEMTSPRVSSSIFRGRAFQGEMVINNGVVRNSNVSESCEGKPGGNQENGGGEIHGWFCPICFEAWTSGGEHQICCLPCGHIYGLSCIKKWLQQSPSSGKCPQCNFLCTFKDVRVLYASRLCVADEELHKRVRSLEARCAYLEQKAGRLTPDELIDQICSNPTAVQRLATVLADLHQQPISP